MSGPLASGSNATVITSGSIRSSSATIGGTSCAIVGSFGEDVARVEAQPQVPDVLTLPAEIAPQAFGLPFAAHALEPLDVRSGSFLPG